MIVITTLLAWLGLPVAVPGNTATMAGVLAGLLGGLAVVLWWIFFSRAARSERWGAIAMAVIALAALIIKTHYANSVHYIDRSILVAVLGRRHRSGHFPYHYFKNCALCCNVFETSDKLC